MEKIGFGPRLVAYIIDLVILLVINFVIGLVLGFVLEIRAHCSLHSSPSRSRSGTSFIFGPRRVKLPAKR